jgi:hypothetical protein
MGVLEHLASFAPSSAHVATHPLCGALSGHSYGVGVDRWPQVAAKSYVLSPQMQVSDQPGVAIDRCGTHQSRRLPRNRSKSGARCCHIRSWLVPILVAWARAALAPIASAYTSILLRRPTLQIPGRMIDQWIAGTWGYDQPHRPDQPFRGILIMAEELRRVRADECS